MSSSTDWVSPDPALSPEGALPPQGSGARVLGETQVSAWREQGFVLVDGVFPDSLLRRACEAAASSFPDADTPEAEVVNDFGSSGVLEFPAEAPAVNQLTLHPRVLNAVGQLLGSEVVDLRLTQSDLWAKYGRAAKPGGDRDNSDQRMHTDYPNHTLTHPPPWYEPEAVELILYLSDVDDCGGATALVPRTGSDDPAYVWPISNMPGVGDLEWINDRSAAEAALRDRAPEIAHFRDTHLYPREVRARFRVGSVLFYRHDTWHRGTPLHRGSRRFAQNMTFRKSGSEWISVLQRGWAWAMYRRSGVMEKLLANASVEQRCVLGFPGPGHPYWTPATLAAVAARFGPLGMDLTPYARALEDPPAG
ncbi:MAG: phytanoyl-CoA dioxygenase family protein [Myxococcales bacterium]|nr:phytanoyl-CoA dioxygenase family protein [Myxococcales bacterium]